MSNIIEGKEFWQQHLEKLASAGMSRKQYCRDNGLNYERFSYWIKTLSQSSRVAFVPVKLKPEEISSSHKTLCTLEIRGNVLKIHDLSVLTFILDRMTQNDFHNE